MDWRVPSCSERIIAVCLSVKYVGREVGYELRVVISGNSDTAAAAAAAHRTETNDDVSMRRGSGDCVDDGRMLRSKSIGSSFCQRPPSSPTRNHRCAYFDDVDDAGGPAGRSVGQPPVVCGHLSDRCGDRYDWRYRGRTYDGRRSHPQQVPVDSPRVTCDLSTPPPPSVLSVVRRRDDSAN